MLDSFGTTAATTRDDSTPRSRAAAQKAAARQWGDFRSRLRTVTPRDVARTGLVIGATGFVAWLVAASWPAIVPFLIGGIVAYALLPVVDRLDRVMPRGLAALVSVLLVLAALVAVVVAVAPPLTAAIVRVSGDLPSGPELTAAIDRLTAEIGAQAGAGAAVGSVFAGLAATVKDTLATAPDIAGDVANGIFAGLLGAIGALLGLVVLPTWMLTVLSHKDAARTAVDRRLAPGIRSDVWAAVAIADRASGAYFRGYIIVAVLVGTFTWLGLQLSPLLGGQTFQEPLALAALAGAAQLVPAVGAAIGLLPAVLLLAIAPERAAVYGLSYLAARYIGSNLVGSRIQGRGLGVHPAIMVPSIVMLGQFGLLWLFLSAPLVAIAHDLVRYAHGRLSDPPHPAGQLPGTAQAASRAPARSVGATYRLPPAPRPFRRLAAEPAPSRSQVG